VINALLRTEALERSTMPYQAELAMAVSAMIFHSFLPEWHLGRTDRLGDHTLIVHRSIDYCNAQLVLHFLIGEIRFAVPPYARER
jgi:hypothetical protein